MKVFIWINGAAIVILLAVTIWAAFDFHNRKRYALIAQGPPLAMMAIRRSLKRSGPDA